MSAIEKIKEKLAKYPEVQFEADGSEITVHPRDGERGFAVTLRETSSGFGVAFEGWHQNFDTEEEALNCVAFGLSNACRLRIGYRGNFPYRWTVETFQEGEWKDFSSTGLLLYPLWRSYWEDIRQNSLVS